MKDNTNRMQYVKAEDVVSDIDQKIEEVEQKQVKVEKEDKPLDLNLEEIFFTGKIEYEFNIGKFRFTLRLPDGEEVARLHRDLWAEAKKNSDTMTDGEFTVRQLQYTVASALVKYGPDSLEDKTIEEKIAYVGKIPAMVMQTIGRCFSKLEDSARQVLDNNTEALKN